jgi:protein-L-isoaspartate O-methyltransferase
MAQMLEDLKLVPNLHVLEIGAGTGYNAALLAHVVGPGRVVTVDVDRGVLSEAWDHLRDFPERRVELGHSDGRHGFADGAPYDRIMVTAATRDLEPDWLEQLREGGLLLAPLALAPGLAFVVCGTMHAGVFDGRLTRAAYFMALRAEHEAGFSETEALPSAAGGRVLTSPWAGWFDRRRPRLNWLGFVQSLAFYGWLRGLAVHYRTLSNGQPEFGVSDPDGDAWCWLGTEAWQVNGDSGQKLGWKLWSAFLDAGGPWPTEFRLRAGPAGRLHPGGAESYLRQGLLCQQLWELPECRERPAWIF